MKKLHLIILYAALLTLTVSSAAETGDSCQTVDDCPSLHSCENHICVHKDLFPITAREVIGTIIILTMNALLTAGGVGGGAAYVPYIMLLFEVDLQKAISYAYLCVFGGGLGNLANTIFLKNPKNKRFLINYDVNLIILPALMIGIMIGLICQRVLPPLVTNIILLFVLAYSMYKNSLKLKVTMKKERHEKKEKRSAIELAKKQLESPEVITETPLEVKEREEAEILPGMVQYDAEHEQQQRKATASEYNDEELAKFKSEDVTSRPSRSESKSSSSVVKVGPESALTKEQSPVIQNNAAEELLAKQRHEIEQKQLKFPFHKLALLLVNVAIIIIVGIIRGTKVFDPVVGVDWSCGWDFLWFALAILFFGIASAVNVYLVNKWQQEKVRVKYEFLHEEPLLNMKRIIQLKIASIVAGIVGAMVALGGAMIISPSLLDMGMPPAFSAAATGVFMIFSMFNALFGTILNKRITGVELAWFLPLAILFSYVSSKVVNYYVRKTGKQSVILILLISITFFGFGCVIYNLIDGMVENTKEQTTFTSVC